MCECVCVMCEREEVKQAGTQVLCGIVWSGVVCGVCCAYAFIRVAIRSCMRACVPLCNVIFAFNISTKIAILLNTGR